MGKGRKPLPDAVKALKGNPGKRPLAGDQPRPAAGASTCPAWISKEGKAEWKRIAPMLARAGMLSKIDRAALAGYCSAWAMFAEAEKNVAKFSPVLVSKDGNFYQNPWMAVRNKQMELMHRYLTEFGMTPSSRTRIKADKIDEGDEIDKFMKSQLKLHRA